MSTYNFAELVYTAASRDASKIAIVTAQDWEITYGELSKRVSRAGRLFTALGIQPGDRVSLLFVNDFRFLEICFGLIAIGAVPVPMNSKLGAETLSYIYEDSGSRILVYHAAMTDKADEVRRRVPGATGLLCLENDGLDGSEAQPAQAAGEREDAARIYDLLLREQPDELELYPTGERDLCLLPYTSGSTGRPKGCRLTHGGQLWNVSAVVEARDIRPEHRIVISLPLYHKNAMMSMKGVFRSGSSAVILDAPDPERILSAIERRRCTYISGVPALYRMLVTHLKQSRRAYDLSSLQYAVCGSSDAPPELLEDIRTWLGADVYEGYGLTEGGPVVLESRKGLHKTGSAGIPLSGGEIRIVGEDERDLPSGEVGELWVRNPGVADGYWNLPDVTRRKITGDGWLKTGDAARQDEEGFVYIVGRQDDMINVGGENVYPKEVENILLKHPLIDDVCVLPVDHALKGQVPVAFVVTGGELDKEEIKRFFIERGPAYAHPREILYRDSLPLTGPGKVDRTEMKRILAQLTAENQTGH
ncbi:class I adenylate-forming enzyme family protein [Saccharibacillus sp. CPCC 101409]|uniref:class I adenylate-forming enzyme family protein n=1 Tax=Saccharibacillus sp. CPCC 101409 TaxID=3058041 RepID=UPI0026726ECA|nr:class I adenylate-forming enzyme family protein [Saccharibacillus sp. CPCC 101409]MDO3409274.1 class I adenylate-forming enzyme family protein [Saccharibacillus sp. CPCC 101409]